MVQFQNINPICGSSLKLLTSQVLQNQKTKRPQTQESRKQAKYDFTDLDQNNLANLNTNVLDLLLVKL